jgi:dTMP kinase
MEKGLFFVLEGIDGCGKTTQIDRLHNYLKSREDRDILTTKEPWKNDEIKNKLKNDVDAYSSGEEMAGLYFEDRKKHSDFLKPLIENGMNIICDRYDFSTFCYQTVQGVPFQKLLKIRPKKIIIPDLTIFIHTDIKTARNRLKKRKNLEKFEKNEKFVKNLIHVYDEVYKKAITNPEMFGKVVIVDGEGNEDFVFYNIQKEVDDLYKSRK